MPTLTFQVAYNVSVVHEGNILDYLDLCAKWNNEYCYDNRILHLADLMPEIESQELEITYPVFFSPYTFETYTLPLTFGGNEFNEDGYTSKKSMKIK